MKFGRRLTRNRQNFCEVSVLERFDLFIVSKNATEMEVQIVLYLVLFAIYFRDVRCTLFIFDPQIKKSKIKIVYLR